MKNLCISAVLLIIIAVSCSVVPDTENKTLFSGPQTKELDRNAYAAVYHVKTETGSDSRGDGSRERPWKSIGHALTSISGADAGKRYALLVAAGEYLEPPITLKPYVDLYGGFNPENWERDTHKFVSILNGEKTHRIMTAANHVRVDGFTFLNGLVRGKGGAISGTGVSPVITNNVFRHNKTLGPKPWNPKYRHLVTNDGGAVYFENGSDPVIENNLFVDNYTDNGRGAGIALHKQCDGRIAGNVFLRNVAGLDDPLRSSDGGAVSVFDRSDPIVENNLFLSNRALAKNDAGGLFVALWASPVIRRNVFVDNICEDDAGALFVGGQEHRYDALLDPIPPKEEFYVTVQENLFIGNSNASGNSGVTRMTMESRGEFCNNITAYNNGGVYFQRSEILVQGNLILDSFLLLETKEGLNLCVVKDNYIWGTFEKDVDAEITGNFMKVAYPGNTQTAPRISADERILNPVTVIPDERKITTRLRIPQESFRENELVNRVIRTGKGWGIVKSNSKQEIEIWGDLSEDAFFVLLPSYKRIDSAS